MKVGMAKAYRVAPPALDCLKVETNIADAKEAAPEAEAGRRQKAKSSKSTSAHQSVFRVGPAIYGYDCSVDYLDHIVMASPDDTVCIWGGKRAVDFFF